MKKGKFALATALIFSHAISGIAWEESFEDRVEQMVENFNGTFEEACDSFHKNVVEKAINQLGDDVAVLQNYFDNYQWKGIIQNEATSGVVTLSDLKLGGHGRIIIVEPEQEIKGHAKCSFNREKCSFLSMYRVILGIEGQGGLTAFGSTFGALAGDSEEDFVIWAPSTPGLYELRFRSAKGFLESDAMKKWVDETGREPDATTTVAFIYVKRPHSSL